MGLHKQPHPSRGRIQTPRIQHGEPGRRTPSTEQGPSPSLLPRSPTEGLSVRARSRPGPHLLVAGVEVEQLLLAGGAQQPGQPLGRLLEQGGQVVVVVAAGRLRAPRVPRAPLSAAAGRPRGRRHGGRSARTAPPRPGPVRRHRGPGRKTSREGTFRDSSGPAALSASGTGADGPPGAEAELGSRILSLVQEPGLHVVG